MKSATSFFIGPVHVWIIFTEIEQTSLSICYVFAFPRSDKVTFFFLGT